MKISYSIWDGSQFLGHQTADSAKEMEKTVKDLQKISKNIVTHIRKVETK